MTLLHLTLLNVTATPDTLPKGEQRAEPEIKVKFSLLKPALRTISCETGLWLNATLCLTERRVVALRSWLDAGLKMGLRYLDRFRVTPNLYWELRFSIGLKYS